MDRSSPDPEMCTTSMSKPVMALIKRKQCVVRKRLSKQKEIKNVPAREICTFDAHRHTHDGVVKACDNLVGQGDGLLSSIVHLGILGRHGPFIKDEKKKGTTTNENKRSKYNVTNIVRK